MATVNTGTTDTVLILVLVHGLNPDLVIVQSALHPRDTLKRGESERGVRARIQRRSLR